MKRKILSIAFGLVVVPSAIMAQTAATEHTIRANEAVKTELDFNDRQDFEDASRGFIATVNTSAIMTEDGKESYSLEGWDFLKNDVPETANPSLGDSRSSIASTVFLRSFQINSIRFVVSISPI